MFSGRRSLSGSLLLLINRSWNDGELPSQWKEARIHPIPKTSRPVTPSDFRPISLLSVVSKIMERLVSARLYTHSERGGHIPDYQSGFRHAHSTLDHLTLIQHHAHAAFSQNEYLVLVTLDINKAYDRAWRPALLDRLKHIGVSGNMLRWLHDFLRGRRRHVIVNGASSTWMEDKHGVPQGSPLSPLLFNIFIAPALEGVDLERALFADDMAVYASGASVPDICERISRSLKPLSAWARKWGVEFNFAKSGATVLTQKHQTPTPAVTFQGKALIHLQQVQYLGVILDRRLSWKPHLEMVRNRAVRKLEFLLSITTNVRGPSLEKILLL